jgi:hypothetical protein
MEKFYGHNTKKYDIFNSYRNIFYSVSARGETPHLDAGDVIMFCLVGTIAHLRGG